MRRILLLGLAVTLVATLYVASPIRAAWVLREAIKAGDTSVIAHKVLWPQVRASLRSSLAQGPLASEASQAGAAIRPTLWQRVKWSFGTSMLDRFVETYVTPEGLPKLHAYRKSWDTKVKGRPDEDAMPLNERIRRFYRRVMRAEFTSLTRFEIELADKHTPTRSYAGVLELHGFEWKLASLRVVGGEIQRPAAPRTAGAHRADPAKTARALAYR